MKKAILITFSIKFNSFDSAYERNKFYRGLYGWKQIIQRSYGRYEYQKEGLLDEIPHIKVDQSVIIIPSRDLIKMINYFKGWRDKIKYKSFEIELGDEEAKEIEVE